MELIINVDGIKIWGKHGVFASESIAGNWFMVDISVKAMIPQEEIKTDKLSATCDYVKMHEIATKVMKNPVQLLEKLALEIAEQIKKSDERIIETAVKVSKLQPPLNGEVKSTSVLVKI